MEVILLPELKHNKLSNIREKGEIVEFTGEVILNIYLIRNNKLEPVDFLDCTLDDCFRDIAEDYMKEYYPEIIDYEIVILPE